MSVNEELRDGSIRHAVFLSRFGGSTARRMLRILSEADDELTAILVSRLEKLGPVERQQFGLGLQTTKRTQRLVADIRQQNMDLRDALKGAHLKEMKALAEQETEFAAEQLTKSIGVDIGNLRPSPEVLRAAVEGRSLRGRSLAQWWQTLSQRRFVAIDSAIRLGVIEGDTTAQLTRRLRDGLQITKRSAEALARTSVNAISSQARQLLFEANDDILEGWQFLATLDGVTSRVCAALHLTVHKIGDRSKAPPRHPSCRSVPVPLTRSWQQLSRKGALKPGRGARDIDALFQKRLKARGMSAEQIAAAKRNAQASMDGQVPDDLTYTQWLKRRDRGEIFEILGPTRGKLFIDGKIGADRFVNLQTGRPFGLDELKRRDAAAFERAGLD